ncbi:hypothetical protein ED733_007415 [Metarhizium rileyi]|uniref:Uncharacterized protein n=1 Tax=Metarhizium rileyi (strain RCEF 4871) TaxID=1649241 RepID=A0A5C6GGP6_METRR|nr:hypothetical protein ED733_007415 [Metarhizium rileyi]
MAEHLNPLEVVLPVPDSFNLSRFTALSPPVTPSEAMKVDEAEEDEDYEMSEDGDEEEEEEDEEEEEEEGEEEEEEEEDDDDEDEDEEDEDEMFTKNGRCQRCLKLCVYSNRSEHKTIHWLQGLGGVKVSDAEKCTSCAKLGHGCIVAKEPRHKAVNTVRCLRCINDKECCSFKETYGHLAMSNLHIHPARTM